MGYKGIGYGIKSLSLRKALAKSETEKLFKNILLQ